MEWLEIVKTFSPVASIYIAWLTYKMNKRENERKHEKELREQHEKGVPLPARSKRPKRK